MRGVGILTMQTMLLHKVHFFHYIVNVVPVPPELTDFNRLTSREMSSMKALQKLSRTFATPIVFRPTEISLLNLKSNDISSLLDYFDPQVRKLSYLETKNVSILCYWLFITSEIDEW